MNPMSMLTLLRCKTRRVDQKTPAPRADSQAPPEPLLYKTKLPVILPDRSKVRVVFEDGNSNVGLSTTVIRNGKVGVRIDFMSQEILNVSSSNHVIAYECLNAEEIEAIQPATDENCEYVVSLHRDLDLGVLPTSLAEAA